MRKKSRSMSELKAADSYLLLLILLAVKFAWLALARRQFIA